MIEKQMIHKSWSNVEFAKCCMFKVLKYSIDFSFRSFNLSIRASEFQRFVIITVFFYSTHKNDEVITELWRTFRNVLIQLSTKFSCFIDFDDGSEWKRSILDGLSSQKSALVEVYVIRFTLIVKKKIENWSKVKIVSIT